MNIKLWLLAVLCFSATAGFPQTELDRYNPVWTSQSKNASESMPCGGGDIGLNVWAENGDILFYMAKSGAFDENNTLLKLGRVRLGITPNPFDGGEFRQELVLREGYVRISGKKAGLNVEVTLWVDIYQSVVHADVTSNRPVTVSAGYESWRYEDRPVKGKENNQNSWKWAPQRPVLMRKDDVRFTHNAVMFRHENSSPTVFDDAVKQQGLERVKDQLDDPLLPIRIGGSMAGAGMEPAGTYAGKYLDTDFKGWLLRSAKPTLKTSVTVRLRAKLGKSISPGKVRQRTRDWWNSFWNRSFIFIKPGTGDPALPEWQAGRNYQLFRYMLGCNSRGHWPTKFNGGLFTYDPSLTDTAFRFTPDFRNWGGGTHTAQNQRLVYWPMLKSGDFDLLQPEFNFYLSTLNNAQLRTRTYWGHTGASFTEQLENYGLPNPAEYGWKRPVGYDPGMEYNNWLEYEWDTVLEFCLMMLESDRYSGEHTASYIPFIESCVTFFDEHYQYLAKKRGENALDAAGHLVLYPGSAAETYKLAYNASSTVAGLNTVLTRLLETPGLTRVQRARFNAMLKRIPPLSFRDSGGHATIAPAQSWQRVNNTESPQLYPVFPWGVYGIGKPGLDTAVNTYLYDPDVIKFRSAVGWKQHNIFAARLGLTKEAAELTIQKLKDSGRRFPAFWGPGFDWTPDHNWGGSGMIGLQEMLLQTDGKKILLFPAWPKEWDVHFKLHAPYQTTVEAELKNGKVVSLKVIPEGRRKDVQVYGVDDSGF